MALQTDLAHGPEGALTPRGAVTRARRCLVSREVLPVEALVRFAVGPDGEVVPDVSERLPGRGLWLIARRDIVARACSGGVFAKAARGSVHVKPDLADHVERLLRRSCLDLMGLARRAGQAVAGFEKAREWVQRERAAVLVFGIGAGTDGREKLGRSGAVVSAEGLFSGEELGRVFGRERIMHVAIGHGNLARRFEREAARLAGFCGAPELGKR